MTTLRQAVKTDLTNDVTLAALLTGGVKDASDFDQGGESLEDAPKEADGIRIKPHAVLRWRGGQATGYPNQQAENRFLEVWFYTHSGYSVIQSARERVKAILGPKLYPVTDDTGGAWFAHAGDLGEFVAEELDKAAADRSRFQIFTIRK